MGAHLIGAVLYHPWFYEAAATSMASHAVEDTPQSVWDRAAACMRVGPQLGVALSLMQHTLRGAARDVDARHQALCEEALSDLRDAETQLLVVLELEALLVKSRLKVVPALIAMHLCLLTPLQLANAYVQCYPW